MNVLSNAFYFILTKIGIAKLVNAQMTQSKVEYSRIAFGDGNGNYYEPSAEATALRNEVYRAPISVVEHEKDGNGNPTNRVRVESIIPATVGNFTIREIGLIDSAGDLVGIGKYPATFKPTTEQGAAKDLIVRIIVETTNADSITLKVDPSIAIASRQYVDQKVEGFIEIIESLENGNIELENLETNNKELTGAINEVNAKVTQHLDDKAKHITEEERILWNAKLNSNDLKNASTTQKGIVQLSSATNSTSETLAATPLAIKTAFDKAEEAFTSASNGKQLLETTIIGKGGIVSKVDNVPTFNELNNGILGLGAVKSIQHGITTLPSMTASVNVPISKVNGNNVVIFANSSTPNNDVATIGIKGELVDSNNIKLSRTNANMGAATVYWTVVEFLGVRQIQRGTLLSTSTTNTVPINTVNPNKSFIVVTYTANFTGGDIIDVLIQANFTSTQINFKRFSASGLNIHWQLIEFL